MKLTVNVLPSRFARKEQPEKPDASALRKANKITLSVFNKS